MDNKIFNLLRQHTERTEYKFLSLTYDVLTTTQATHLNNSVSVLCSTFCSTFR